MIWPYHDISLHQIIFTDGHSIILYHSIRSYCEMGIPSFYITASGHIARWASHQCHFWKIRRPLRAWQPVLRGFRHKSFLLDVISEKFKIPCGHDNLSFGIVAPTHFAGSHLLRKQQHYFVVFQKTCLKDRFSILFGHNYFLNSAIRNFRRFNHTNSARRSRLKGWWGQKVG